MCFGIQARRAVGFRERFGFTHSFNETIYLGFSLWFFFRVNTTDLLVLFISFATACFTLNIYKINRTAKQ